MNGDVTVKTKDGGMIVRIPYTTIKKIKLPNTPAETTKQVASSDKSPIINKKDIK
ncbi:MAG: hypothetical protein WCL02_04205 [bacterium]